MALISCENLTVAYEGKPVISKLNFSINQGDRVFIIGENGSGKTTLMQTLLGLKKPTKGKVVYGDGLKQNEIGYLQQKSISKNFPASVFEVVISGRLNKCGLFYKKQDKQIALENLEKMGILNLKNKSFSDLSGGQQQRVLLARALCATSKLLMLDEPLTGLDAKSSSELSKTILKLNKDNNVTLVVISHNFENAMDMSTHILHLGDYETFFGTIEEYKQSNLFNNIGGKKNV